jgi:hypothetical protein
MLRFWRRKKGTKQTGGSEGFHPRIGFTRLDGMASLSLLIENRSRTDVWLEEIEIFLSSLTAEQQTASPTCHEIQKIRQMVQSDDVLPISLCETIYKAAGDPQRKYSCVLSSVLRYRLGEERLETKMETYRVRMLGLTADDIHRERNPVPPIQTQEKSKDVPAAVTGPK